MGRVVVVAGVVLGVTSGCAGGGGATPSPNVVVLPPASATGPAPSASTAPTVAVEAPVEDAHGCLGKCRGSAPAALSSALQGRAAATRRCYNEALRSDPKVVGKMRVRVRVGADGSVCSTDVVASDMPTTMDECARGVLGKGPYPAPNGGCIDAEVPMSFVPMNVPDAGP
jgi:outer membrane biosynthesis protein TonB